MSEATPPAPGVLPGGGHAGARRGRRAFRFCVTAFAGLTLGLWFAENYLRYDLNDSQYRMALLHEAPSARATLRNVVKRDADQNDTPRTRYIEALATLEEDDLVLPRYEQAYRLSPNDPNLAVKYGCRLFLLGRFREARERFREAGIHGTNNALPQYLEAAALAAMTPPEDDLSEAVALVARANATGYPVVFPQPLWHPSLPEGGIWHLRQKRRLIDICSAPLYRLRTIVAERVAADLDTGHHGDWDAWLERLQGMGERLSGIPPGEEARPGVVQAIAGIQIQLDALRFRARLAEAANGAVPDEMTRRILNLEAALETLGRFEEEREEQMALARDLHVLPWTLFGQALLVLFACYFLTLIIARGIDRGRESWALPHASWLPLVMGLVAGAQCALLLGMGALAIAGADAQLLQRVVGVWWAVLLLQVGFGFIYPFGRVPRSPGAADLPAHPLPRKRRLLAGFARRYFGIALGLFICVFCGWVLSFRITTGLYPGQLKLLVPGYYAEELREVRSVQETLLP